MSRFPPHPIYFTLIFSGSVYNGTTMRLQQPLSPSERRQIDNVLKMLVMKEYNFPNLAPFLQHKEQAIAVQACHFTLRPGSCVPGEGSSYVWDMRWDGACEVLLL